MSLHPPPCDVIPEQTLQVARAAFPKGNPSMRLRDALGPISTPPACAALFSHTGRPAEAPAQLALITVMQVAEGRSDVQAAAAPGACPDTTEKPCWALGLSQATPFAEHARMPASSCRARGRGRIVSQACVRVAARSRSGTARQSTSQNAGMAVRHLHRWCGLVSYEHDRSTRGEGCVPRARWLQFDARLVRSRPPDVARHGSWSNAP
jgi:hypothetical protein